MQVTTSRTTASPPLRIVVKKKGPVAYAKPPARCILNYFHPLELFLAHLHHAVRVNKVRCSLGGDISLEHLHWIWVVGQLLTHYLDMLHLDARNSAMITFHLLPKRDRLSHFLRSEIHPPPDKPATELSDRRLATRD